MRRALRIFLVLLGSAACLTAAAHRFRVHPNPSIVIRAIAEGPDGLLWLAAEDGLYRFDGFHYHKIPDFPFDSGSLVGFTADGTLWCGGSQGLAQYRDGFKVVLTDPVRGLAVLHDSVIVSLRFGLIRIRTDGSVSRLQGDPRGDLTVDSTGAVWFVSNQRPRRACFVEPGSADAQCTFHVPDGFVAAVRDSQGRTWGSDRTRAVTIDDGQPARELHRTHSLKMANRIGPLLTGRNGQLWFLGEAVTGISPPLILDDPENERFPPTAGYEDSHGHLWVAYLGRGIVEWILDPSWRRWYSRDLGSDTALQVVRTTNDDLIAVGRENLFRLQVPEDRWLPIAKTAGTYQAVLPLAEGGFLAFSAEVGLVRLSQYGQVVRSPFKLTEPSSELLQDGKGHTWLANSHALMRVEKEQGSYIARREDLPEIIPLADGTYPNSQASDLELDDQGRLWVGYDKGIAWLDDQNRWRKLSTDQPVTGVRSFALAEPSDPKEIWVAKARPVAFARLRRGDKEWHVTSLAPDDSNAQTRFLQRDTRGWIWRGSTEGVHVSDGRNVGPNDWLHLHATNGLASGYANFSGFFEDSDGGICITAGDGVTCFKPDLSWFNAPRDVQPPQITRLEADRRQLLRTSAEPDAVPADTPFLRVDVGSLHAPSFREYPFRYRLLPLFSDWRLSRDGTLEFHDLPENNYTLEVAYTGNGESPTLTHTIRVGAMASKLSWYWLAPIAFFVAAVGFLAHRSRRFSRARYWTSKSLFLLRRRFHKGGRRSDGDQLALAHDSSGKTLAARYQLIRPLARSEFSVVYDARDLTADTRVAVKVLIPRPDDRGWVRDQFAREVAALRSIEHPGVVRILDSWVTPSGEPCLAMEYLNGPTLRAALGQGALAPERVAHIVRQLGTALSIVHSRGIVHRDLKPENVILLQAGTPEEQPVLIDFGTAAFRGPENALSSTTLVAGSLNYMPPERLTGYYSTASDIYSLGVITLEMLTSRHLADLNAVFSESNFLERLRGALGSVLAPEVASALAERLRPALHPTPSDRPADVMAWAEGIGALLSSAPRPSSSAIH